MVERCAERLEQIYADNTIYKSLIICGTDEETRELALELDRNEHTVVAVTMDQLDSDRPLYMDALHDFQDGHARVILASFPAWSKLRDEFEVYVLPEQNLIAYGDIDDDVQDYLERHIANAAMRGFISQDRECLVIQLLQEDYLSSE